MGCYRTLFEMKIWHKSNVDEKIKILEEARRRKESDHLKRKS